VSLAAIIAQSTQPVRVVVQDHGSSWVLALAAGAIGAVAAGLLALAGRAASAWRDVSDHDAQAHDLNRQLRAWIDDRTRKLVQELNVITNTLNPRGLLYSGIHGGQAAEAKTQALHEYRDQRWRTELALQRLAAAEGPWHRLWRGIRDSRAGLGLPAAAEIEPFLARWREPVTRHGSGPTDAATPFDPTTRTFEDALAQLPALT
jgi:hypothetical protein